MAWGGARPGAGRKKVGGVKANPNRPRQVAETKLPARAVIPAEPKENSAIDPRAWAMMLPEIEELSRKYGTKQERTQENNPFRLPDFPKNVIPPESIGTMAMDSNLSTNLAFGSDQWLSGSGFNALPGEGLLFLGFTYLAELAQRPEYRVMAETIADDATRKWIDFDVVGDEKQQKEERDKDPQGFDERMADPDERKKRVEGAGKMDKVKALKDDQLRLMVKDRFYDQYRNDGHFGRSHLFLDIRANDSEDINSEDLKSPLGDSRDSTSKTKCPIGAFKGLRTIEPVWTYPLMYNAVNPLREDWYNPQVWYVMGQEIHGSRLQTFIGHPVPDMLKPAYSFGGLSLTQLAKPYVDIWLQTRQSVAQLIHSFSVMVLMTDLNTLMQPGNMGNLLARVAAFNMFRDNMGTFVLNEKTEDFKNVSASLSGLHELQAQAQEHMASVHRIPLVKFTGIQPAGLNACLPGNTLIFTDRGQVPIREVTLSDRVMTRRGFAPLTFSGITEYATELIEISTASTVLRCTANHPIWLRSTNAFVRAENVRRGDRLLLTGGKNATPNMHRPWHGAGSGGGRTQTATISLGMLPPSDVCISIGECGKRIAGLFQKVFISTCFAHSAEMSSSSPNFRTKRNFAATLAYWPIVEQSARLVQDGHRLAFAGYVTRLLSRFARMRSFARANVQLLAKIAASTAVPTILHIRKNGSGPANKTISETPCADRIVSVKRVWANEAVYDLSVAPGHLPEFFAAGILVHNSSEGEIKTYDDTISALQSRFADPNLRRIINFQQLSLWGEIDPEITHRWEQLREMTLAEKGQKQKDDADRHQKYVDMGAFSPGEIRKVAVNDPDLEYTEFDPEDIPEPPAEEGLLGPGTGGGGGGEGGGEGGGATDGDVPLASDAWNEGDHPRGQPENAGQFGPGGGGGSSKKQMGEGESGTPRSPGASSLYNAPSKSADQIVAGFPGGAEAIQKTRARLAEVVPTDSLVSEGGFKNPDGTYTEEREAIHRQIAAKFFPPEKVAAALPPKGQKPVLIMLGGRGGSGKSWLTGKHGPVDESKAILVDADAVKAMLPGYEGWNASSFHEESSHILSLVDQRAVALGVNTIHDATMKSEATAAMRMAQYEAAGYEVEGYYMYAAPETAATRAMARYSKGGKFNGRFVPPEIILGNVNNEKNFDKLSGGFRKWAVYDNNTAEGPKLISRSHDD